VFGAAERLDVFVHPAQRGALVQEAEPTLPFGVVRRGVLALLSGRGAGSHTLTYLKQAR
jgi:hypothetical protein